MELSKEGVAAFVTELATYYMDFLETDFHKRRLPKRSVKFRNSKNLRIGLNLAKYTSFQTAALKIITNDMDKPLNVSRGKYQARISQNIQRQIEACTKRIISDELLADIGTDIADSITNIANTRGNIDDALSQSVDYADKAVRSKIVTPFVRSIEKLLYTRTGADIESVYSLEENLVEILTDPLEEPISDWVASVFSGQHDDITSQITQILDGTFVEDSIKSYFNDFSVNDLFFEIKELVDNNLIMDKQDIYFYFCDIQFQKEKYPLFYVPLTITKQETCFHIAFEPTVYINKKAIEYIVQEFNKEQGQQGTIQSLSKRIIYPQEYPEPIPVILNQVLSDIINFFQLSPEMDFTEAAHQEADGLSATVTNSMYICIFDKSDEALVNDYEEILELMKSQDTELIGSFTGLINNFIGSEPISFKNEIEGEWSAMPPEQKLVFSSPIPLNPEQRQILHALDKKDCKYIAVEGPPGTGKSHTITAIVFQAILRNQSVLMLSDKKEALDVIEEKITDVMNRVRIADDFQNPILRLGKTGNTYGQILSTTSINQIRQHSRAANQHATPLETSLCEHDKYLTSNIETTVANYEDINIADIRELTNLDCKYERGENYPIIFDEVLKSEDDFNHLGHVWQSMAVLDDTLHDSVDNLALLDMFQSMCNARQDESDTFFSFLAFAKVIQELRTTHQDRSFLKSFNTVTGEHVKALNSIIEKYRELGSGIFGYFLKGKNIAQLSHDLNAALSFNTPLDLRKDIEDMERASAFFGDTNSMLRQHSLLSFLPDPLPTIHELMLPDTHLIDEVELDDLSDHLKTILTYAQKFPCSAEKIGLSPSNLHSCSENDLRALSEDVLNDMILHLSIHRKLSNAFQAIPHFDYAGGMASYQELLTNKMTNILDGRLLNFYDHATNTAKTLRDIIKNKQRFPRKEFEKLKEAFPCIVAGIRDYAEYIPLEPEMFDIVIIDEASQVSIAQAFPALLRAKKVVVLGDKKQFSNVKTAQARSDTNNQYINRLDQSFRENVSSETAQLARLTKFNIKTSILEFFEYIPNFEIMLLKHFRGYRELISYSSKEFYGGELQAIRIRAKSIDDTIKFSFIEHDGKQELAKNTNTLECEFILNQLRQLKAEGTRCSVGIITPHTNQQKLIASVASNDLDRDYYYDNLNLKIMTFDTCQGEEKDIIFYSMVASPVEDKLWGIFIKDLDSVDLEEGGKIKAQRLNVGFSRAKECMHFVLSKPIEKFEGSIGQALRHYECVLRDARQLPDAADVDSRSPMEAKVVEWIKNTAFFQNHSECIELKAQFPIGEYLNQLDPSYDHPAYCVDFLFLYRDSEGNQYNIIIEYDGFNEHFGHFTQNDGVNAFNYDSYYTAAHVEREKILEGYGYRFLRINRFNVGKDPVATLSERLLDLTRPKQKSAIAQAVHKLITDQENGRVKKCPKCGKLKNIDEFADKHLITGIGRKCNECKAKKNTRSGSASRAHTQAATAQNKCPKCGAPMVRRTGRYGAFFGCSTYPKCHGTRKTR
jgi:hypothetical protein